MENLISNKSHEKQIIILMIPKGEELKYLATKKLFALLKGITSKFKTRK